jgi:hypothetical protein
MQRVPGGQKEAWWQLENGDRIPVLDVAFGRARYCVERLVARYRKGADLVVVKW